MVYVAKEMEKQGFKIPLLIGGATTSRIHTAVKVNPCYSGSVVHVLDASKSVPVASRLLSPEYQEEFHTNIKAEYEKLSIDHANRQRDKNYTPIAEARENKFNIDWDATKVTKPSFLGTKTFTNYSLAEIAKYIDWTPFFQTWELHGKYPRILTDEVVGESATKLFADVQEVLKNVIANKSLTAKAVIGFWPANTINGDDITLFEFAKVEGEHTSSCSSLAHDHSHYTENRNKQIATFCNLRQQGQKASGIIWVALR